MFAEFKIRPSQANLYFELYGVRCLYVQACELCFISQILKGNLVTIFSISKRHVTDYSGMLGHFDKLEDRYKERLVTISSR